MWTKSFGIAMGSLIKNDDHISNTINNMFQGLYRALKGRVNGLGYPSDERLMPYLELARFGSAALIRTFDFRYDLISALVERWCPETHTFHLPCGECTVTLEDVALQLGLPIIGTAVMGISTIPEPTALCYSLLGVSPNDVESKFMALRFLWLKVKFEHLSINTTEQENVRSYSWGSIVLAMLYRELFRTTKPNVVDIGGCFILLQSWALYRMPFLASVRHQAYVFPLGNSTNPGIKRLYTIPIYRLMIEQHAEEGFIWMPYRKPEIVVVIPSFAHIHSHLWCINAPIINFQTVEWYNGDRVLRQFGCIQYILAPPM
ncbi:serine/threonine-protein phosphatase 7 long form homolog [Gossypium raimondii]|uniref:serine/threonine-protein phosphatase 7 long form homolog n=1 Tax=Gossypium raimondii TaxID=29730 RepID=UPI00227A23A8|nr:serine/threonine-protein phosphatase 7 long form homolog [Gossypium raimondii]